MSKVWRILAAGAVMGIALWFMAPYFDAFMTSNLIIRVAALALLCGVGALIYGVAAIAFGAYRVDELRSQFSRKKAN